MVGSSQIFRGKSSLIPDACELTHWLDQRLKNRRSGLQKEIAMMGASNANAIRCELGLMCLVLFPVGSLTAFQVDALRPKIDQVFAQYNKPDSPGCAVAVVKDGTIIHQYGYGMAD